jgi:hypothetical protein
MKIDLLRADFVAAFAFSDKIEDSQVRPFIGDARTLDILPLLGHETLERLAVAPELTPIADYVSQTTLAALSLGALVLRRDRIYKTLVANPTEDVPTKAESTELSDETPQQAAEQWRYLPLATLWQVYLKPYWLQAAFVRFLLNHGVNVTKAGLTVPVDRAQGTYDRPSSAQVAQLLADTRITAEARLSRLTRFLKQSGLLACQDSCGGYDRVVGDAPLTADERARYTPNRRRHKSPLRGV